MIRASGYIPQISVVVGFAAGGAAYGPALTDVVIMAAEGRVSSPDPTWCAASPVRTSTWRASAVRTPTTRSRVCHIVADDELDAYARGRRLVGLFCQQGHFDRTQGRGGRQRPARPAAGVGAARV